MALLILLLPRLLLFTICVTTYAANSRRFTRRGAGFRLPPARLGVENACGFIFFDRIRRAIDRARVENYVQDVNLQLRERPNIECLLIVLELGDAFSRQFRDEKGNRMNLSNSDKVSLPESILTQLTDNSIAVPWQFVIQKVHRCELSGKEVPEGLKLPSTKLDKFDRDGSHRERVACTSLDFRNQESYIFLPRWMMESLDLKPYDVVYLSQIKLPEAIFVRICPLEQSFFNLDAPKAVLEEHLKHYGSLTRGATIRVTHEGVTYNLRILSIETEDSKDVECATIQDLDVSIDLVKTE